MRRIAVIFFTLLLLGVICLQILAALNIFPRQSRVQVCPVNAISMQDGKAVIDASKCIGCRRCVAGIYAPAVIARDTVYVAPLPVPAEQSGAPQSPPPVVVARTKPDPAVSKPAPEETQDILYQVNSDKCVGCGLCTIYCPTGAITMVGDKAVIDPDKCINCGICKKGNSADFKGCPFNAVNGP